MKNELMISDNSFQLVDGQISFPDYERLMIEASEIAHYVKSIEVSPENVKENKKLLANMNKVVKQLNDRRIAIKKEILEPYDIFAGQIKSIETVIKDADEVVRNQVRELEEAERNEKQVKINEIWNMRRGGYDYARVFSFEDWIEPRHLNKTTSMKSVEEDMVEFLEKSEKDLEFLHKQGGGYELINIYKDVKDVTTAINIYQEKQAEIEKQKEILKQTDAETDTKYVFVITDKKDAKLTKMLLDENAINYEYKGI